MSFDLSMNYNVVNKRTGDVVGQYSADEGQCIANEPAAEPAKNVGRAILTPQLAAALSTNVAIKFDTPWYESAVNLVSGLWKSKSDGAPACDGSTGDGIVDHLGDGHVMGPSDASVMDGAVPHPTDDGGNLFIGEGFINPIESAGTELIQGTGLLAVRSGRLVGSGLQNVDLEIRVATNPLSIYVDWNENGTVDASDIQMGCFDGLVNMSMLTAEEYENRELWGLSSAPPPYDKLWSDPADPNNRLPLYLAYYYLICYANGEPTHFEDNRFYSPEDLLNPDFDPSNSQRIGTVCTEDASDMLPYVIDIPSVCNQTGEVDLEFGYEAYINARSAVDATYYAPVAVTLNLQGE